VSKPRKVTGSVHPVMLRQDMPRDAARAHWAGAHAEILRSVPGIVEYVQQHFSATDHGFWPATPTVGTPIPGDWHLDGFAETRLSTGPDALRTLMHMRGFFLDEQNCFERVLGHLTGPAGGRWWSDGFDDTVGQRVALLLRRRRGVRRAAFRRFVHDRLGPALHAAGARDLRTYTFIPWTALPHPTPGVSQDNPPHRRYHGAVVFGADDRAALDRLIASDQISAMVAEQHVALTAAHAYAIEMSLPAVRVVAETPRA
jgi:hypothetical protein